MVCHGSDAEHELHWRLANHRLHEVHCRLRRRVTLTLNDGFECPADNRGEQRYLSRRTRDDQLNTHMRSTLATRSTRTMNMPALGLSGLIFLLHYQSHLTYFCFTNMSQNRRPVGTKGTAVRVKTNAFAVDMDLSRLSTDAPREYFHFSGTVQFIPLLFFLSFAS